MNCPTCGAQPQKALNYMGAAVCPHCGCVMEYTPPAPQRQKVYPVIAKILSYVFMALALAVFILCNLQFFSDVEYAKQFYEGARCVVEFVLIAAVCAGIAIQLRSQAKEAAWLTVSAFFALGIMRFLNVFIGVWEVIFCYPPDEWWLESAVYGPRMIISLASVVLMILYLFMRKPPFMVIALLLSVAAFIVPSFYLPFLILAVYTAFKPQK